MKIEIVEAYPIKLNGKNKKRIAFSLHIYIIDLDIDLRGINVIKYKDDYIVRMPHKSGKDEETNQMVIFPIFSFANREKTKEFTKLVKEKTIEYLKNKENI